MFDFFLFIIIKIIYFTFWNEKALNYLLRFQFHAMIDGSVFSFYIKYIYGFTIEYYIINPCVYIHHTFFYCCCFIRTVFWCVIHYWWRINYLLIYNGLRRSVRNKFKMKTRWRLFESFITSNIKKNVQKKTNFHILKYHYTKCFH